TRAAGPTPAQDPLLAALADGERRVDELAALTHTPAPALLARLTELEVTGAVRRTDGGGYIATGIGGAEATEHP
ncbi:MAG: hypothetical protein D6739_05630, partial [Nitrospirae bacterium]